MSAEALHETHSAGHHGHSDDPHEVFAHQFMDRAQSNESYVVGMWSFLVTEVMFFGGLFLAYLIYRYKFPTEFAEVSRDHLNTTLGFINTLILLTSSLFVALGVRAAQLKQKNLQLLWIALTIACAFGFLIVKYFEYSAKFEHHLVPGPHFVYEGHASHGTENTDFQTLREGARIQHSEENAGTLNTASPVHPTSPEQAQGQLLAQRAELFLSLYFIMTGLHGFHVVVGILLLGTIWLMIAMDYKPLRDFMPVELAGLYWHFVDIVWIFLYPFLYLMHPDPTKFFKF